MPDSTPYDPTLSGESLREAIDTHLAELAARPVEIIPRGRELVIGESGHAAIANTPGFYSGDDVSDEFLKDADGRPFTFNGQPITRDSVRVTKIQIESYDDLLLGDQ